jgi:hypothetical protein
VSQSIQPATTTRGTVVCYAKNQQDPQGARESSTEMMPSAMRQTRYINRELSVESVLWPALTCPAAGPCWQTCRTTVACILESLCNFSMHTMFALAPCRLATCKACCCRPMHSAALQHYLSDGASFHTQDEQRHLVLHACQMHLPWGLHHVQSAAAVQAAMQTLSLASFCYGDLTL